MEGKVKMWNDERGWGFIIPDDGSNDIFVHRRDLNGVHGVEPRVGDRVFYLLRTDARGLKAVRVRVLENPYRPAAFPTAGAFA